MHSWTMLKIFINLVTTWMMIWIYNKYKIIYIYIEDIFITYIFKNIFRIIIIKILFSNLSFLLISPPKISFQNWKFYLIERSQEAFTSSFDSERTNINLSTQKKAEMWVCWGLTHKPILFLCSLLPITKYNLRHFSTTSYSLTFNNQQDFSRRWRWKKHFSPTAATYTQLKYK